MNNDIKRYKNPQKRLDYMKKWRKTHKKYEADYRKKYYQRIGKKSWYKKYFPNRSEEMSGTCKIGRKYELKALKLLKGSIDKNRDSFRGKWDIEWNGKRIDVKSRQFNSRRGWKFTKKENNNEADYYLLFCLNNEKIEKLIFVPKKIFKEGIGIGKKSKYDIYQLVL
ncbi:MAG: hypothetical protein WC262_13490 [Bacteroidales bacterium]|jgi:hypothetical protein